MCTQGPRHFETNKQAKSPDWGGRKIPLRRSLGKNHWIAFKSATPVIHRRALKILFRSPETHPGLFLPGQKTSNYRAGSLFLIFFKKKKKKKVYNSKKEKERERRVQRTCKTRRAAEFSKGKREDLQFAQEEKLALFTPEIVARKMGWAHVSRAGRGRALRGGLSKCPSNLFLL